MKMTKAARMELKKSLKADALKRREPIRKSAGDADFEVSNVNEKLSLLKCLRGNLYDSWAGAEAEHMAIKKIMSSEIGSAGGFVVPEPVAAGLIELLRANSVLQNLPGINYISMSSDTLSLGRQDSDVSVTWGGEADTIAEGTNLTFGEVKLELKKMVARQKLPAELIMNASIDVEDYVQRSIAAEMVLTQDLAVFYGTGGSQPTGLFNHANVTQETIGAGVALTDLTTAVLALENANSMATGWVSNPTIRNYLRNLLDTNIRKVVADGTISQIDGSLITVPTIYGSPYLASTQILDDMFVGKWSDMLIGEKPGMRIQTTDTGGDAWAKDLVEIRVIRHMDVALRHPESFYVLEGITS